VVPNENILRMSRNNCQQRVQEITAENFRLRASVDKEKEKASRAERQLQEILTAPKKKPWDRWLSAFSLAVSVMVWLIPNRNEGWVIVGCTVVFLCLLHPALAFPWIEKYLWRRIVSLIILSSGVAMIGYKGWPRPYEGIPPLVITNFERIPDEIKIPTHLGIQIHVRNTGPKDINVRFACHEFWANNPSTDFRVREKVEEQMWRDYRASPEGEARFVRVAAFEKDHWFQIVGGLPIVTPEILYELHHTKVAYWMGQFFDKKGRVITEFCLSSGYDDSSVRNCVNHNGPPQN
jgi:hypothetical protein